MRHITAVITHRDGPAPYEALILDLPLPVITGRTFAEVQDNLLTALQHHVDLACEAESTPAGDHPVQRPDERQIAQRVARVRKGSGTVLQIPEYLIARN